MTLESQQRSLVDDRPDLPILNIGTDKGPLAARRILDRLAAAAARGRSAEIPMTPQGVSTVPLETMDRRSVFHPATSIADHLAKGPRIIVDGSGVMLTDSEGRRYLDAVAGLWCVNIGYGRPEVADAMAEAARRLGYYHTFSSFSNEPQIRLADRLLSLAPAGMSKVFFGNSGSDANDTQIKLVWYYNNLRGKPQKKKIIGRLLGYHGTTVATASVSGLPSFHRHFDLPIPNFLHASTPHHYRHGAPGQTEEQYATMLADELDALIRREGPTPWGRSSPSRSWAGAAFWCRHARTGTRSRRCSAATTC